MWSGNEDEADARDSDEEDGNTAEELPGILGTMPARKGYCLIALCEARTLSPRNTLSAMVDMWLEAAMVEGVGG